MDGILNNVVSQVGQIANQGQQQQQPAQGQQATAGQPQQQPGGFNFASTIGSLASGGNMQDKLNSMAGGGAQGEANEDYLDKAVDLVQEKFLGAGPQDNETAAEQAKDEVISDMIRDKYKQTTGRDFFIPDKEQKFGA